MKKSFRPWTVAAFLIIALSLGFAGGPTANAADEAGVRMALVKQSTLEEILQRGELRVGFEAGYVPFEMTDKKGNFVGFDIDMAKETTQYSTYSVLTQASNAMLAQANSMPYMVISLLQG